MQRLLVSGLFLASLLASAAAQAVGEKKFGNQGQFSLAAERLFGLTQATTSGGGDSVTTMSLLGSSGLEVFDAPYSVPRLGFDYLVSDGLSIGVAAQVAHLSNAFPADVTLLGAAPRLGYIIRASDGFSIWPRAGVNYVRFSGNGSSSYILGLTLEAQFVFTPLQHVGLTIAPTADIGLAATDSNKVTQFGLVAGLLIWL